MQSTTIEYLGLRLDVDFVPDDSAKNRVIVESVTHNGVEMLQFLECMHTSYSPLNNGRETHTALDSITEFVEHELFFV